MSSYGKTCWQSKPGERKQAEQRRQAAVRPKGITAAQFNRVKAGMTYSEVVAILGQPSEKLSQVNIAGHRSAVFMWQSGLMANCQVTFTNGAVVITAQFGLK